MLNKNLISPILPFLQSNVRFESFKIKKESLSGGFSDEISRKSYNFLCNYSLCGRLESISDSKSEVALQIQLQTSDLKTPSIKSIFGSSPNISYIPENCAQDDLTDKNSEELETIQRIKSRIDKLERVFVEPLVFFGGNLEFQLVLQKIVKNAVTKKRENFVYKQVISCTYRGIKLVNDKKSKKKE